MIYSSKILANQLFSSFLWNKSYLSFLISWSWIHPGRNPMLDTPKIAPILPQKMGCCDSPKLSISHFLVLNESLEHRLNAILQKICPGVYQFLRTRWNVPKFLILLDRKSILYPKFNLKSLPEFWSCLWTLLSFNLLGQTEQPIIQNKLNFGVMKQHKSRQ